MRKNAAHATTPQSLGGIQNDAKVDSTRQQRQFVNLAARMGWQLAVVVLVPLVGGALLDRVTKTTPLLTFVGLTLAVLGSILVMWRTMQAANSLPVPKLSAEQRRAVQKSYEEDDD